MSQPASPTPVQWISSHGQPHASNDAYYNVAQVQYISFGPSGGGYAVDLGVNGLSNQRIYDGFSTLADAQAKAQALAEATGIVVS